jgi:hypothetical protein
MVGNNIPFITATAATQKNKNHNMWAHEAETAAICIIIDLTRATMKAP